MKKASPQRSLCFLGNAQQRWDLLANLAADNAAQSCAAQCGTCAAANGIAGNTTYGSPRSGVTLRSAEAAASG